MPATKRDMLGAKKGYLRKRHVALLLGVDPRTVFNLPAAHILVGNSRYYQWTSVLAALTPETLELLELPETSVEALVQALALEDGGKMLLAEHTFQCGDPNPLDASIHCTKPEGHKGFHQTTFSDNTTSAEWGPTYTSMQRMSANKAQKLKAANVDHPHVREADVSDPTAPDLPHVDSRSKFMGRAVKLTQDKLDALPEYSWRIPKVATMQGQKWKANRNIQQPHGPKEWWVGEHMVLDDQMAVRWCCVQLDIKHPEKILPDFVESDPVLEEQFIEGGKK